MLDTNFKPIKPYPKNKILRKIYIISHKFKDFIRNALFEISWIKSKPCAACKNFSHFMGSAGICTAKNGCPATRMKDYSDCCDCNCFKKRKRKDIW